MKTICHKCENKSFCAFDSDELHRQVQEVQKQGTQNAALQAEQLRSVEKELHSSQLGEMRLRQELAEMKGRVTAMEQEYAANKERLGDMVQRSAKMNANQANRVAIPNVTQ